MSVGGVRCVVSGVSLRLKQLGFTMCILAFSSFRAEVSDRSTKKPGCAELNELKDEKARMHIVHPSFFILQLTESAEIR